MLAEADGTKSRRWISLHVTPSSVAMRISAFVAAASTTGLPSTTAAPRTTASPGRTGDADEVQVVPSSDVASIGRHGGPPLQIEPKATNPFAPRVTTSRLPSNSDAAA